MAIRNIRTLGDDILRAKAKEITEMTPRIEELIDDMFDTMYEANGIGPADAPIYKIKDVYSKIIYVKHKDREVLNSIHEKLDVNIVGNQAFKNINVQYDING